jgi:hypothetical protein
MKVVIKPLSGTVRAYFERTKDDLTKVLSLRGDVIIGREKNAK